VQVHVRCIEREREREREREAAGSDRPKEGRRKNERMVKRGRGTASSWSRLTVERRPLDEERKGREPQEEVEEEVGGGGR